MKPFDPITAANNIIHDDNLIDDTARKFIEVITSETKLRSRELRNLSVAKWIEKDKRNPLLKHIHLVGFNPDGKDVYVRMYSKRTGEIVEQVRTANNFCCFIVSDLFKSGVRLNNYEFRFYKG